MGCCSSRGEATACAVGPQLVKESTVCMAAMACCPVPGSLTCGGMTLLWIAERHGVVNVPRPACVAVGPQQRQKVRYLRHAAPNSMGNRLRR